MAQTVKEVHHRAVNRGEPVHEVFIADQTITTVARLIELMGGIIISLLGLRVLLDLLAASRGSIFVNFIYNVTYPLVAPFFGMFNTSPRFGVSHFELETLFAMLIYALLTWLVIRLVVISEHHAEYH